ncbi:hypothetical protein M0804_011581 [Polistes exclamans]|nr:hypothetical protein M0804_011581 [Polistes exclamans]
MLRINLNLVRVKCKLSLFAIGKTTTYCLPISFTPKDFHRKSLKKELLTIGESIRIFKPKPIERVGQSTTAATATATAAATSKYVSLNRIPAIGEGLTARMLETSYDKGGVDRLETIEGVETKQGAKKPRFSDIIHATLMLA